MESKATWKQKALAQNFILESEAYFVKMFEDVCDWATSEELVENYKLKTGYVVSPIRAAEKLKRLFNHDLWKPHGVYIIEIKQENGITYYRFDETIYDASKSEAFNEL